MHSCQNNLENYYTEKKAKHIPSGWAWSLTCSFDASEKDCSHYRGENCIEKLCKKFKELALEIINYEEKEMIPLTDKDYDKVWVCHICKKEFSTDKND